MNFRLILKVYGVLFLILGNALLVPLIVAFIYQDAGKWVFALSASGVLSLGLITYLIFADAKPDLRKRDAFFLVGAGWFVVSVVSAVPFYVSGFTPSFVDAWFEAVAGFTTTGASVISDVESLPHSILMWRSLTQYLGGMGIIVLSVAILPLLGVGGMELYKAEAPGPTSDKIGARVSETARVLWIVYLAFALIEAVILWFLGMTPFDAINHSITTMATGGFSTKNNSLAHYNSAAIDYVVSFFMLCAGVNFILHYRFFVRRQLSVFADRELRLYLLLACSSMLLIALSLWGSEVPLFRDALRYSVFQVSSLFSSTGFATTDFALWNPFCQLLLLLLMVVGGCAGSTAGGIKCIRALILLKQGLRQLYLMLHPRAVSPLKLGTTVVSDSISSAIFAFFFLYIMSLVLVTLILTACGLDLVTSISATISALSNIGPGLGQVGPTTTYAGLPDLAKIALAVSMLIGRLEIFTVLVLFTPEFWRR